MTTLLVDGDILVYRIGFTTQDVDLPIAKSRMNTVINNILDDTAGDTLAIYLTSTDKSNFRFDIFPQYKANRVAEKPKFYYELRDFLQEDYDAEMVFGMEADDALGIAQTEDSIIVSIDKDLDQIPGAHYNFVKETPYMVSDYDALRFFYYQLLVGDRSDNVPGCPKIGPKRADSALSNCRDEADMQDEVYELYRSAFGDNEGYDKMVIYGQVLKIKRSVDEGLWLPKYLNEGNFDVVPDK